MDPKQEAELLESLAAAYSSIYEADYHRDQAEKEIRNLNKQDPDGKDPAITRRKKAWQKLSDREGQVPKDEHQKKLFDKGNKALKDLGHKPKQKPGPEAAKIKGMAKHLKNKYGSPKAAAAEPKVKKRVDGIYNKMLKRNEPTQIDP